jgi:cytochrome c-type biogenesis protein CcmH
MFWIISAGLILIALAILLPSLLGTKKQLQDNQRAQNITIANEQLADLEGRYKAGEMNEEAYQSTRAELEQALFADVNDTVVNQSERLDSSTNNKSSLLSSLFIALLIPAISIPVYLKVGTPLFTEQLDSKLAAKKAKTITVPKKADGSPDLDAMVAGLQKKMEENPDNAKGWFMLGRSYMVLKRYPESAKAFDKSLKLKPDSAQIMLSLADALAMENNGEIVGRPIQLINNALKIEPDNLTALWLGGMAARQQKNYVVAIERWQKLIPLIKEPAEITEVRSLIDEAMQKLSRDEKKYLSKLVGAKSELLNTKAGVTGITVTISLSDEMKLVAKPTDTVFIYAKAMSGPPMPLAAIKKQVKDLPFTATLDDSMAMMPTMKLSAHSTVKVGARVSMSGQPIAQNGDLFTEKKSVKLGDNVELVIDSIVSQ